MREKSWIAVFLVLLIIPSCLGILIGDTRTNTENRELASFPSFSINNIEEYPRELEQFYDDHLPLRDFLINLNSRILYYCFNDSANDAVLVGKDDWLFVKTEQIKSYKRINLFSDEVLEDLAIKYQSLQNYCDLHDMEFVIFIAPNKSTIYPEKMPEYIRCKNVENSQAEEFQKYIESNTDVRVVFPKKEILKAKEMYPQYEFYYALDGHWNQLGAYIGTKTLLDELGLEMPDFSELKITELEEQNFGIPSMLGIGNMRPKGYSYDVTGYGGTRNIDYSFQGDDNNVVLHSDGAIKKKIFFIRDSFFTAMEPYVGAYYSDVRGVHKDLHYTPEMLETEQPDIVVLEVVERDVNSFQWMEIEPQY